MTRPRILARMLDRQLQWSLVLAAAALALPACGTHSAPAASRGNSALGACPSTSALFPNAICVCTDFNQSGHMITHADPGAAANIGVNGRSNAATGSRIDGSWSSGDSFTVSGDITIRDNVYARNDVTGDGTVHVGGAVIAGGKVDVGGDFAVAGGIQHQVMATDPCGCDPAAMFDVVAAVEAARTANDDAAHGLSSDAFAAGAPATLTLESGRYFFDHVTSIGSTKILAQGNVAVYIDGGLDLVGDQQLALAPGATLDLYVNGDIGQSGVVALGGNPPSSFRLFVGGARAVLASSGDQAWSGLIYAPTAWVTVAGRTNLSGALFAGRLDHSGDFDVWYHADDNQCPPDSPPTPTPPTPTPPTPNPPTPTPPPIS
jgi:hypothetical protein